MVRGAPILLLSLLLGCATSRHADDTSNEAGAGDGGAGSESGATDDGGGGGDGGGTTAGPGVNCNGTTCSGTDVCCASSAAGLELSCLATASCKGDAGTPVECDGPEDCDTLNPICCANVIGGPVEGTGCPWTSGKINCTGRCNTVIGANCGQDLTTAHVCHTSSDCAGNGDATTCCEYRRNALSIFLCVDDAHKQTASKCY